MNGLKAFCIAFSIFSKIPMPHFEWKEKELRYHLIFFPWIGGVIGLLLVLWQYAAERAGIGQLAFVLVSAAIPLLVTGGFHVDGFMDTMDALKSYKSREEKLEILKDPHVGAFAVIMLAILGLIWTGAFSEIRPELIPVIAAGFFLARALSGIAVLTFPNARKDGMLHTFHKAAKDGAHRIVLICLLLQTALCIGFMIFRNPAAGALCSGAALLAFWYYHHMSLRQFGGITGDTAGFFVTVSETVMTVTAAVYSVMMQFPAQGI